MPNQQKLDELWQHFLSLYQTQIETVEFNAFYADSKLHLLTDTNATIVVQSDFAKLVLNKNKELIEAALAQALDLRVTCEFVTNGDLVSIKEEKPKQTLFRNNIQSQYDFDSFVVGSSNKEAHAAALASAISPGKFITPLFIYGNSGLGKTHLLHAIGNYVIKHLPDLTVYYIPCIEFVNEYINSLKEQKMDQFDQKYMNIDVLLVDDIQFLAGKEKSHEVFFHIFNNLVLNKKQIVITSDRHPDDLSGLQNRLVSRFSSGLSIGIDSPEFETALAILKKKIELHHVDIDSIDEDVLHYIASKFAHDIRRLEGTLNRLLFYAINFQNQSVITMDLALNALRDYEQPTSFKGKVSTDKIKKVVADYYNLTPSQLSSKIRTSNIALARHIAMYLCREELDLSFIKIGEAFGNRDHSTVMSACDKITKALRTNVDYQRVVTELKTLLKNS